MRLRQWDTRHVFDAPSPAKQGAQIVAARLDHLCKG